MKKCIHGLVGVALVSTSMAGDLGKGLNLGKEMKLEYGKRGLETMTLGEGRKVSSKSRVRLVSPRKGHVTDAGCLTRLRDAGIRISLGTSRCGYRVELGGELRNVRYRGNGYWIADYQGMKFMLTNKAKADHELAIRSGRVQPFQMGFGNGGCLLKSVRE
jgi:hypothetical protein